MSAVNAIIDVKELQQLIELVARDRDQQAFSQLFEHYAPLIRAYSLAREPGAYLVADELVQEVLVKLWNKAHLYNSAKANANTWIFTLARNCRIDYLRRNGRYATEVDPEDLYDSLEDDSADPFEATQQKKTAQKVREGLKQLPVEQSQVLAKVYLEGKTQQETAGELNLPLGTVKSRVRLALQKLEILIRGYGQ
ncbi:sigma-70 family RNA polymerase sigma factor [Pseudomaricurvus alkylphenolicus]|jgi:RNA polymerase sigma-70 factor (ECF subfamily)|uniref:sigma-70 family RNA polymerase sigma factor n=1 Tax=Pseudomaricurvus alkylphenolicus TaxID=1306991 RepID=UPI001423CF2B|nr:sigma-70 family RNA polymerase sigma factor [Pseudomaricurvus alkylphenolicus]NIB43062.1 sigma-70 family RNA polymerase sigma factor [Pseudomaricurvus alkylphenolicus]